MINFLNKKTQWTQKRIQKVLEEKRLGLAKKLNLSCPKPKCFNCQVAADYKIRVKGINMIQAQFFANAVHLVVQKIINVMLICIEK